MSPASPPPSPSASSPAPTAFTNNTDLGYCNGKNWHLLRFKTHDGQKKALKSTARFILLLAGTQSGKTVAGVLWLFQEIRAKGAGDYLAVAPSFQLMQKKMLPEFLLLFERTLRLGEFKASERTFYFRDGKTKVFFGHADDPESLESATAKAAWLDEAGQKRFRYGSWEAIQRRLAIHKGRVLITTTPYSLGWLKQQVYDRAVARDPDYAIINFDSIANPAFPRDEYERARRTLPRWRFDMMYRGRFTRPAGLIYDCFDENLHKVPTTPIPKDWPRALGLDFGGINTAAVFLANEPGTAKWTAYREYYPAGDPAQNPQRTIAEHAQAILTGEPGIPRTCAGGAKSEGQWRAEFRAGGMIGMGAGAVGPPIRIPGIPLREPLVHEVEVGIERVYAGFKEGNLFIQEHLAGLLDEIGSYSREVDENGVVQDDIEDKETFHRLDALRYISTFLFKARSGMAIRVVRL